jgi:exopolyphosphatase / guanosine-5'-triphosphate,3'-diphosphate pyrophosphatase
VGKFAVIDIGSNSVRLVVYENLQRAPYVVFNEKVFCGLGRGISDTGGMLQDSMDQAVSTLKRFAILLDNMRVTDYKAVATSAVRDAHNQEEFISRVKNTCDLKIEIIDGLEEARLSAGGVLCAIPYATGIVGDLGGGSLELAFVNNKTVHYETSLPIGPLQLQDKTGVNVSSPKKKVDKYLGTVSWLKEHSGHKFYAVGGAWRTMARIHMHEVNYPLINMHNYVIPVDEITNLCLRVSKMHVVEIERYRPYISSQRIKVLSLAALTLHRLLKIIKPSKFVVSAFGVREGILFNEMAPDVRMQDPLIVGCYQVAQMTGRFAEHGERLFDWIGSLFTSEIEEDKRLRMAICILCDVGWRGHPEYRAEKVVSEILFGRLSGINHRGGGLIAVALNICYGESHYDLKMLRTAKSLISKQDLEYATKIGLALRLAQRLSAGTSSALKLAKLVKNEDTLILKIKSDKIAIVNLIVEDRLKQLAKFLDLKESVVCF